MSVEIFNIKSSVLLCDVHTEISPGLLRQTKLQISPSLLREIKLVVHFACYVSILLMFYHVLHTCEEKKKEKKKFLESGLLPNKPCTVAINTST